MRYVGQDMPHGGHGELIAAQHAVFDAQQYRISVIAVNVDLGVKHVMAQSVLVFNSQLANAENAVA